MTRSRASWLLAAVPALVLSVGLGACSDSDDDGEEDDVEIENPVEEEDE